MDRDESVELFEAYSMGFLKLVSGAGTIASLAWNPDWAGPPTERLRDELIATIDELEGALARLGDRVYPPPVAVGAIGSVPRATVDSMEAPRERDSRPIGFVNFAGADGRAPVRRLRPVGVRERR